MSRTLTAGTGISVTDNGSLVTVAAVPAFSTPAINEIFTGIMTNSNSTSINFYQIQRYLCVPILVDMTVDRIGVYCDTAASGGATRLGIYASDANNRPGALVLDAGTVDTSTTGEKTITISQALTAGIYWLTAVEQGNTSVRVRSSNVFLTLPVLAGVSITQLTTPGTSFMEATVAGGTTHATVTGALASTATVGYTQFGSHERPIVSLRRSA